MAGDIHVPAESEFQSLCKAAESAIAALDASDFVYFVETVNATHERGMSPPQRNRNCRAGQYQKRCFFNVQHLTMHQWVSLTGYLQGTRPAFGDDYNQRLARSGQHAHLSSWATMAPDFSPPYTPPVSPKASQDGVSSVPVKRQNNWSSMPVKDAPHVRCVCVRSRQWDSEGELFDSADSWPRSLPQV
jgi:hypothetical protein